jgi:hypothetical protein
MVTFEVVPTLLSVGAPVSWPVELENVAQIGGFVIANVIVPLPPPLVVGVKL